MAAQALNTVLPTREKTLSTKDRVRHSSHVYSLKTAHPGPQLRAQMLDPCSEDDDDDDDDDDADYEDDDGPLLLTNALATFMSSFGRGPP